MNNGRVLTEQDIKEIVQSVLDEGEWQKYFASEKPRPAAQRNAIADMKAGKGKTPGAPTPDDAADAAGQEDNPRGAVHTKEFGKKKGNFVGGKLEEALRQVFRAIRENIGETPQKYTTTGGGDGGEASSKQDKNYQTSGAQVENPPSNGDKPAAYDTTSAGDSGEASSKQDKNYQTSGAQVEGAPTDGDKPQTMTYEGLVKEIVARVLKEGNWVDQAKHPRLAKVKKDANADADAFEKGEENPEGGWAPPSPDAKMKKIPKGVSQMAKHGITLEEDGEELAQQITEQVLAAIANFSK